MQKGAKLVSCCPGPGLSYALRRSPGEGDANKTSRAKVFANLFFSRDSSTCLTFFIPGTVKNEKRNRSFSVAWVSRRMREPTTTFDPLPSRAPLAHHRDLSLSAPGPSLEASRNSPRVSYRENAKFSCVTKKRKESRIGD